MIVTDAQGNPLEGEAETGLGLVSAFLANRQKPGQPKRACRASTVVKLRPESGNKKSLSDRSVAKLITLLGTVFRFAQRQELMDSNPAAAVRKPRAAKHVPYVLDAAEIGALRNALDIQWQRLLVELTITTGLRSGEVRALAWDNVDIEGSRFCASVHEQAR